MVLAFLGEILAVNNNVSNIGFLPQDASNMFHLGLQILDVSSLSYANGPLNVEYTMVHPDIASRYIDSSFPEFRSSYPHSTYVFDVGQSFTLLSNSVMSNLHIHQVDNAIIHFSLAQLYAISI